jgi:hypothetical protein
MTIVYALQNEIMLYDKLWNCVLQQTMNVILNPKKKKTLGKEINSKLDYHNDY